MDVELLRIVVALVFAISALILLNRFLNLHAFFCLLLASLILGLIIGKSFAEILTAMQAGFGSLLQHIGFIVAIGSCLGMVLEKTGAMEVISQKLVYLFGAKRSVLAMSVIGMIVGIPVFCDSGFIILSRLIPSIAAQASVPAASLALALSSGLYTTHTMVPPTPGPLAAAVNLGLSVNLGEMIVLGMIGSIPVGLVGFLFSRNIGRHLTLAHPKHEAPSIRKLSPLKAFLPLVLPIALIAFATLPPTFGWTGVISHAVTVVGQPVVALLLGLILSFSLISRVDKNNWPAWITEALKDAGIILLIVGAGGAFGFVIKSSGVDLILKSHITAMKAGGVIFLCIGFVLAAILKTAQGSTTSSMIITSSLLAPLAATAGFVSHAHLSILVLAIGGGAMTISHVNDAYFWVVSQFGGFSTRDAFRSFTLITLFQGLTALATSIILLLLW
jgi:GntP family gluconate:H+ symporter